MPYNFTADSSYTKKNFVADFLQAKCVRFYTENGRFAFLRPPLGDLRTTYDDYLKVIGKRVVDFLLVLIKLFFARCYG